MRSPDLSSDDMEQEEISTSRRSGRNRIQSRRQRDALDNLTEERAARAAKRAKTSERADRRAQHNAAANTVVRPSDNEEMQRLKELLHSTQAILSATEEELSAARAQVESSNALAADGGDELIPRPKRMDHVNIKRIRRYMNLEGDEHKDEWTNIRSTVREYLRAGRIQWSLGWKEQKSLKLGKIYNAIEAEVPALRRFRGSWATEYLAKHSFGSHRSYETCKNDGSKYRGKFKRLRAQAAAYRKQRTSLTPSSDGEQGESSHEQTDSSRPHSPSTEGESD
ncbi:hypothetical protein BD779DRAFT_1477100 [Infundibulicybe gibba]|nr:hypothetical protein BD779DRAFT_1477100 [Infundibulicybe gibba]